MTQKYPSAILGIEPWHQGKSRDTFLLKPDSGTILPYTTNRISTHNHVHLTEIPLKGECLTALVIFFMKKLEEEFGVQTHMVAYGKGILEYLPKGFPVTDDIFKRSFVARVLDMISYEFIGRDFMCGSLFDKHYSKGLENPYGLILPEGLQFMSPLNPRIFTPTLKNENDDPVFSSVVMQEEPEACDIFFRAYDILREYLFRCGYTIVDMKGELGRDRSSQAIRIGDEIGTLDCMRIVRNGGIVVGQEPVWQDKQVVRDEVMAVCSARGVKPCPIELSPETVKKTTHLYLETTGNILKMGLEEFQAKHGLGV